MSRYTDILSTLSNRPMSYFLKLAAVRTSVYEWIHRHPLVYTHTYVYTHTLPTQKIRDLRKATRAHIPYRATTMTACSLPQVTDFLSYRIP